MTPGDSSFKISLKACKRYKLIRLVLKLFVYYLCAWIVLFQKIDCAGLVATLIYLYKGLAGDLQYFGMC